MGYFQPTESQNLRVAKPRGHLVELSIVMLEGPPPGPHCPSSGPLSDSCAFVPRKVGNSDNQKAFPKISGGLLWGLHTVQCCPLI